MQSLQQKHAYEIRSRASFLPESLTTVTPFSKLLAMILFILFPFVGFYIGTKYQMTIDHAKSDMISYKFVSQQLPTPTVSTQPLPKSNTNDYYLSSGIAVVLPNNATYHSNHIFWNGSQYAVQINSVVGLCPNQTYGVSCNYTDKSLPNVPYYRIWKDNSGIFALNPQAIALDNHYLNSIVVIKVSPTATFTPEEVVQWESIFRSLKLVQK